MRLVVAAAALLVERFEQMGEHPRGDEWAVIGDLEHEAAGNAHQPNADRARRRAEIHGILDQLVE